jgi:transketolase
MSIAEYGGNMSFKNSLGDAYGKIGKECQDVVFVTSDVGKSFNAESFIKEYGNRYVNVGIAEQNAIGVSAGLVSMGFKVIFAAYAMFATGRGWELIRNYICYPNLDVKIIATHGGINVGEDGATHQATEDIALMRSLPNMKVFVVEQPDEVYNAITLALSTPGPCYVRIPRADLGSLPSGKWECGKGLNIVDGDDVSIIATGLMVRESLLAAQILKQEGINCRVINMRSIKPLDTKLVDLAAKTGKIVTCEEHNIFGGLFSSVAEHLASHSDVKIKAVALNDCFAESGSAAELMKKYKLTCDDIVRAVKDLNNN